MAEEEEAEEKKATHKIGVEFEISGKHSLHTRVMLMCFFALQMCSDSDTPKPLEHAQTTKNNW